ncbi:hypothetical protein N9023_04245 [Opitutaceae bacterium]|nr:hypothetical protein [Opitutaceae bacterium]MDB4474195.1 hypothetical protein [Opitutaceae bacterium]
MKLANIDMPEVSFDFLSVAKEAVSSSLDALHTRGWGNADVISAMGRDLKTEADLESNRVIRAVIERTQLPILSEEEPRVGFNMPCNNLLWIVDPLDGTVNFERGFPHAGVSLGLWKGVKPVLGVVGDLCSGKIYSGQAASTREDLTANENRVSLVESAEQGILATGFPTGRDFSNQALQKSVEFWRCFKKVRMIGSAALSLARVSDGTFDAYCEEGIWWWDVAGAIPLVLSAGGRVWMTPPDKDLKTVVFASNGRILPPPELQKNYENLEEHQNTG